MTDIDTKVSEVVKFIKEYEDSQEELSEGTIIEILEKA